MEFTLLYLLVTLEGFLQLLEASINLPLPHLWTIFGWGIRIEQEGIIGMRIEGEQARARGWTLCGVNLLDILLFWALLLRFLWLFTHFATSLADPRYAYATLINREYSAALPNASNWQRLLPATSLSNFRSDYFFIYFLLFFRSTSSAWCCSYYSWPAHLS